MYVLAITQTPGAPPMVSPSNVGGGGGSVGTLTISWNVCIIVSRVVYLFAYALKSQKRLC